MSRRGGRGPSASWSPVRGRHWLGTRPRWSSPAARSVVRVRSPLLGPTGAGGCGGLAGQQQRPGQAAGGGAVLAAVGLEPDHHLVVDRKSTRLNSSHVAISYAVFCLKKKEHH